MALSPIPAHKGDDNYSPLPKLEEVGNGINGKEPEYFGLTDIELDDIFIELDDIFRMYHFKVRLCQQLKSEDEVDFSYAHQGEMARCIALGFYDYNCDPCPNFGLNGTDSCARGDSCHLSHGLFDRWLHLDLCHTSLYGDVDQCKENICFFAHTQEQISIAGQYSAHCSQYSAPSSHANEYSAPCGQEHAGHGINGKEPEYFGLTDIELDDIFRMYHYKVSLCQQLKSEDEDEDDFSYAHLGEMARCIALGLYDYNCDPCPNFGLNGTDSCARGDSCHLSHGLFERWLHPDLCHTSLYGDEDQSKENIFFTHTQEQISIAGQYSAHCSQYSAPSGHADEYSAPCGQEHAGQCQYSALCGQELAGQCQYSALCGQGGGQEHTGQYSAPCSQENAGQYSALCSQSSAPCGQENDGQYSAPCSQEHPDYSAPCSQEHASQYPAYSAPCSQEHAGQYSALCGQEHDIAPLPNLPLCTPRSQKFNYRTSSLNSSSLFSAFMSDNEEKFPANSTSSWSPWNSDGIFTRCAEYKLDDIGLLTSASPSQHSPWSYFSKSALEFFLGLQS